MDIKYIIAALIILSSCTTAKQPVSDSFSKEATSMPVKGINGWLVNQKLSFGDYSTSAIKRGWDFSASLSYTKFSLRPEEALLKVFDISTERNTNTQRNKFQYTLSDGTLITEIYATEKFKENQLVYKSNNPWIGNASKTNRFEYAFTAGIIPLTSEDKQPWSLVLINKYDITKDTARKIFDQPFVEEEGYATNGKENIAIRPLRSEYVATKSGKKVKTIGGKLLTGYEVQWNGSAVAMIDILDHNILINTNLGREKKLVIASIASAILLKRMQDVEKDRERFD
jgi:hypothetical protein